MIKRLAHVCVESTDLDASLRFYRDCLQLPVHFKFTKDGEMFAFYLDAGEGTFLEVFTGTPDRSVANSPLRHFCLEVDSIDTVIERLREFDYEVTDKWLAGDGAWQAWTDDPSGVRFEFHQYEPHACQLTGEDCVC